MDDKEGAKSSFAAYEMALFGLLEAIVELREVWEIQRSIVLVRIAGAYFHNIEFDEDKTWEIVRHMLTAGEAVVWEILLMMHDAEDLETAFYNWLYD